MYTYTIIYASDGIARGSYASFAEAFLDCEPERAFGWGHCIVRSDGKVLYRFADWGGYAH